MTSSLPAGKLDTRIAIERRAAQAGAPGGVALGAWSEIARRWASVRPLGGRQVQEHALGSESADVKIAVRACAITRSLTTADRITIGGRVFGIVYVEPCTSADALVWFQADSRREN